MLIWCYLFTFPAPYFLLFSITPPPPLSPIPPPEPSPSCWFILRHVYVFVLQYLVFEVPPGQKLVFINAPLFLLLLFSRVYLIFTLYLEPRFTETLIPLFFYFQNRKNGLLHIQVSQLYFAYSFFHLIYLFRNQSANTGTRREARRAPPTTPKPGNNPKGYFY